jgi:hypothetical protein
MIGGIVQMATVLERTLIQCSTLMGSALIISLIQRTASRPRVGGLEACPTSIR